MKRSSLVWSAGSISQISSRNRVPPFARAAAPSRSATAPVKAPFTWPKISLSISSFGMAPQLIATKGLSRRGLCRWIASAQTSLPVPDLAGDEHGGAAGRGAFDDPVDALHGERAADEAVEAASRQFLGVGIDDLGEAQPLDRVAHRHHQPVGGERLDDEIVGAVAHRLDRHIDGGMGGDDDDCGRDLLAGYVFQDLHAVHIRQLEIQQHDLGRSLAQCFESRGAGFHGGDRESRFLEVLGVDTGQRRRVFNQQNLCVSDNFRSRKLRLMQSENT